MWFVGGIVGFILGVAADSGAAMLLLALLGAFVGHMISRSRNAEQPKPASTQRPIQTGVNDSLAEMRQKITRLEGRLQTLEREVAELKAGSLAAAPDIPIAVPAGAALASEPDAVEPAPDIAFVTAKSPDPTISLPMPAEPVSEFELDTQNIQTPSQPDKPQEPELQLNDFGNKVFDKNATDSLGLPEELQVPALAAASLTQETTGKEPLKNATQSSAAIKRAPPTPPKTFRESLPAPLARLLFGGNTLVKAGVLILFLGLAFLLRYTAERVTVPVELRYAGVAMMGVVLLGLGWFLRKRRRDYALILQGMAIGVFYLTTLSAMKMHALVSPEAGFGFMFLVSVLSAILAVLQNAPMLAIVAALEGFATPVLTATGENRPMGLFTYMAVLDVGICLVAWFNAWRVLNLIGFVGTFTLALGWADKYYTDAQYGIVQPFLIFYFVLFALIGLFFARKTLQQAQAEEGPLTSLKRVGRVDSALVFGNPVTAFGLQYMLVRHTEFGAAFSALAVGFFYLLLARLVFSRAKQGLALLAEAYVIVAAIFATLAIPLGLEGIWTGAAWAVEGAGMYWLGIRQQRPYARGFAYVVMLGAAYKLLHGTYINPEVGQPLLQGSWLGPVLLALSCFTVWNLHRRAAQEQIANWEQLPNAGLPWLGVAAIGLLPWMFLPSQFAAAALALMALPVAVAGRRIAVAAFRHISATLQAFALVSFMLTLHAASAETSNAALADGWRGGLAAVMIAGSILYSAGRSMLAAKRAAQAQALPPSWSVWNSLAVISGTTLLHLAMLFAIDLTQAAAIWPVTSCMLLWVGLRMSHSALAAFAGSLQVVSAFLSMVNPGQYQGMAFAHLGFLTPLSLALSAWFSADRICAEAVRMRDVLSAMPAQYQTGADDQGIKPSPVWINQWCDGALALGLPILWGLSWWMVAWFPESLETLERTGHRDYSSFVAVMIGLGTTVLMSALAAWRKWPQMGKASLVGLPLFMFAALIGLFGSSGIYLPSAHLGWLAWPLALAWHLQLLKKQQTWCSGWPGVLKSMHILGFWFFLLLAAREGQVRLAPLADTWSSWPLLGWILVPALVFWFIGAKPLAGRWPLLMYRKTYIEHACAPVALYLLVWCWTTNAGSAGNASPLPYLPLLNPLELGQWLVVASLLHWWRALSAATVTTDGKNIASAVTAVTALALLTGMVLRSCHHFADVPWDADAMFASRLSQAAVSITWAVCGVAVMLFGNRRMSRGIWIAGAVLLAVVVLKLFLVELADRGGLYRIVSFIGVGILLLVVGYFAPVPVKPKNDVAVSDDEQTSSAGAQTKQEKHQ